jgi:hypothetical protein
MFIPKEVLQSIVLAVKDDNEPYSEVEAKIKQAVKSAPYASLYVPKSAVEHAIKSRGLDIRKFEPYMFLEILRNFEEEYEWWEAGTDELEQCVEDSLPNL